MFYLKDERENRCIGEVLERYRGEDAGDLETIELEVLVENWSYLNAPAMKFCKSNPKILMDETSWKTWKSNQKIVTDEDLVQKVEMDEELVQKVVMDEELVRNVVMDGKLIRRLCWICPCFKIRGWNFLQTSNRKMLEEVIEENDSQLLSIKIPSGNCFLRCSTWNDSLCVMIRT